MATVAIVTGVKMRSGGIVVGQGWSWSHCHWAGWAGDSHCRHRERLSRSKKAGVKRKLNDKKSIPARGGTLAQSVVAEGGHRKSRAGDVVVLGVGVLHSCR